MKKIVLLCAFVASLVLSAEKPTWHKFLGSNNIGLFLSEKGDNFRRSITPENIDISVEGCDFFCWFDKFFSTWGRRNMDKSIEQSGFDIIRAIRMETYQKYPQSSARNRFFKELFVREILDSAGLKKAPVSLKEFFEVNKNEPQDKTFSLDEFLDGWIKPYAKDQSMTWARGKSLTMPEWRKLFQTHLLKAEDYKYKNLDRLVQVKETSHKAFSHEYLNDDYSEVLRKYLRKEPDEKATILWGNILNYAPENIMRAIVSEFLGDLRFEQETQRLIQNSTTQKSELSEARIKIITTPAWYLILSDVFNQIQRPEFNERLKKSITSKNKSTNVDGKDLIYWLDEAISIVEKKAKKWPKFRTQAEKPLELMRALSQENYKAWKGFFDRQGHSPTTAPEAFKKSQLDYIKRYLTKENERDRKLLWKRLLQYADEAFLAPVFQQFSIKPEFSMETETLKKGSDLTSERKVLIDKLESDIKKARLEKVKKEEQAALKALDALANALYELTR